MRLNRQKLEATLKAEVVGTYIPFSLHFFDTVGSTNQTLWYLLEQGATVGTVVIATQQTAGRGQWGRQWTSPSGGLYLSVAIAPQLDAHHGYQLTLATAWGIAARLRESGVAVKIKWPNDLILNLDQQDLDNNHKNYKKLGGILTETKVYNQRITQAVIGVGINWTNPVPETGISLEKWQASWQTKPISCLEILIAKILLGIESGIHCLFEEGVNILLSNYMELLTNMGDPVWINNITGTVVGVNHMGELRVRVPTAKLGAAITSEIHLQPGTISLGYSRASE